MTSTAAADNTYRLRLLDGLATSIAEKGYRDTTVADVVRHARTSKRTFYDQFGTKESCFVELLRTNNATLVNRIRDAVDPNAPWRDQISQAVGAYVDHIESAPAVTLSWIRELPALGADARPLQRAALHELTDLLIELSGSTGFRQSGLPQLTPPMAIILLGGLRELTALTVEDARTVRDIYEPALAASVAILNAGSPQQQAR